MSRRPLRHPTLLALVVSLLAPSLAGAHFILRAPASWREQDALGGPQKVGPCGNEGTAATTGVVTPFAPGETITITLDETIFHPGHYRVALAVHDRSELPAEPPVTAGATACGSVPIMTPPIFPVLADGMLAHEQALAGTQSIEVTLPADVTCTRCTLQVLEFMSNHGAPCFYHHCADIAIQPPGVGCTAAADCDDGNACTRDTCEAQACVARPLLRADTNASLLGTLDAATCPAGQVPPGIRARFRRAGALLTRAASNPAKAGMLLERALARLQGCARGIQQSKRRSFSPTCRATLTRVVDDARMRVGCLQTAEH